MGEHLNDFFQMGVHHKAKKKKKNKKHTPTKHNPGSLTLELPNSGSDWANNKVGGRRDVRVQANPDFHCN